MEPMKDEPAFPKLQSVDIDNKITSITDDAWIDTIGGLTVRKYFAIRALQGLCAGPHGVMREAEITAKAAKLADSLIAELEKKE